MCGSDAFLLLLILLFQNGEDDFEASFAPWPLRYYVVDANLTLKDIAVPDGHVYSLKVYMQGN